MDGCGYARNDTECLAMTVEALATRSLLSLVSAGKAAAVSSRQTVVAMVKNSAQCVTLLGV